MGRTSRILTSAFILATAAPPAAVRAQATDLAMGTWVLNVARSKYESGAALKSQTRTFTSTANGYKFTADAVSATGQTAHSEFTAVFDNKYHAIAGNPAADSLMVKRVDAYTVETTQKKGSTMVTFSTRTISKDGKTMTNTSRGINNDGKPYTNVEIFEKK